MQLLDDTGHGVELHVTGYQFPDAEDPRKRCSWHVVHGRAVTPDGSWDFRYPGIDL
jgi:hypothetical protein